MANKVTVKNKFTEAEIKAVNDTIEISINSGLNRLGVILDCGQAKELMQFLQENLK